MAMSNLGKNVCAKIFHCDTPVFKFINDLSNIVDVKSHRCMADGGKED